MAKPRKSSGPREKAEASPAPSEELSSSPPAGEDEWLIDGPLPADFEIPPGAEETPKPAVRMAPIAAPSGASAFESNPKPQPQPQQDLPPAAIAAPKPFTKSPPATLEEDDTFHTRDELPVLPPNPDKPVESAAAPAAEEEEAAPEAAAAPGPAARRPWDKRDKISLAIASVLMLALAGIFAGVLYANRPNAPQRESATRPSLPMEGAVARLTAVETDWRVRRPGDRVSTVDATLPTVSRHQPALLPEVKFTIDPGASKEGYLRFIFLDPEGVISGDVRVVKISAGRVEGIGSGTEASGQEGTVYGSLGFLDNASYLAYATGKAPRWSVEVSESTDYNAKEEGWTPLGAFDIHGKK